MRKTKKAVALLMVLAFVGMFFLPAAKVSAVSSLDTAGVIIEDQMIPMSDGTLLAAKVYRPAEPGTYPTLLSRTPYNSGAFQQNRDGSPMLGDYADVGLSFAKKGYAVVVQDVRGKYASQGENHAFLTDGPDGYDTLEWIARQSWSNQSVGTFGASARGMTQTALLGMNSPYLKAMFVIIAPSKYFEEVLYQGGAFRQELVQVWQAGQNISDVAKKFGPTSPQLFAVYNAYNSLPGRNGLYWFLPLRNFPTLATESVDGTPYDTGTADYDGLFDHYIKDGYFDYMDISLKHPNSHVPVYEVGGWYDIFREGTITNFVGLQENGGTGAKGNQKMLLGPWQHRDIGDSPKFKGDEVDIYGEMQRWFDYWLKDINNGIMDEKPVRYFDMGSNTWQQADAWPVKAKVENFYFHAQRDASGAVSLYDGSLSRGNPNKHETPNQYVYDPNDPTITIGGQLLFPDVNVQNEKDEYGKVKELVGPEDQREAEKSSLTFTTNVLEEDIDVTGQITATVYASSNRRDTDFVVRLSDVAPDGTSTLITDGILRARFRQGQDKEVFLDPGKVYPFKVNLGNTSITFKKGHRIRVTVASSNFPRFDRNANTGNPIGTDRFEDLLTATNTIYHDSIYPSHISLPVVVSDGN